MKNKPKYRVRNWRDYNRSLRNRENLTFWISEDLIDNWLVKEEPRRRGHSFVYTEAAILAMASVKFVFQ
ncbi:MAG TPA: transposase, partial [Pyrinomonadaceae bacterium]|nr:transposase [Pyrinomonadaceae bacterium]